MLLDWNTTPRLSLFYPEFVQTFALTDGPVMTSKGQFCIGAAPKLETLVILKRR